MDETSLVSDERIYSPRRKTRWSVKNVKYNYPSAAITPLLGGLGFVTATSFTVLTPDCFYPMDFTVFVLR